MSVPSIAAATHAGQTAKEEENGHAWDAGYYGTHCSFVSELGSPVLDLLAPIPEEWVLDLGCGDGTLAAQIKAVGCHVLGVTAPLKWSQKRRRREWRHGLWMDTF